LAVLLENIASVLLKAEESPFILLEHASVVIDLPLKDLVGIFGYETAVGNSPVENTAFLYFSASIHPSYIMYEFF
jgi:hypothetical protein